MKTKTSTKPLTVLKLYTITAPEALEAMLIGFECVAQALTSRISEIEEVLRGGDGLSAGEEPASSTPKPKRKVSKATREKMKAAWIARKRKAKATGKKTAKQTAKKK